MLSKLKIQFYSLIKDLGYKITDNGDYVEDFPWLMLRTGGYKSLDAFNTNISTITLILDIFSNYPGEKEIIEIIEDINNNLSILKENNSDILFYQQKTTKILDDKSTGPVRKHGVVSYEFLLGYGVQPEGEEVPHDVKIED